MESFLIRNAVILRMSDTALEILRGLPGAEWEFDSVTPVGPGVVDAVVSYDEAETQAYDIAQAAVYNTGQIVEIVGGVHG